MSTDITVLHNITNSFKQKGKDVLVLQHIRETLCLQTKDDGVLINNRRFSRMVK